MEILKLNKRQQRRGELLNKYLSGDLTKFELMSLLGLSCRQTDRIIRSYLDKGLCSLVHGNKCRIPANKLDGAICERIIALADSGGKYNGFNLCHLIDMLLENESIEVSRSSLRRLLVNANVVKPDSVTKHHRKRRKRSSSEGLMIQIDGSIHDWLCGRGDKMCLMGAIDDATGGLVYAGFRPSEDQCGYIQMLRNISMTYGIPGSCYHDKHTILRSPKEATIEDELSGKVPMSQVQRIMHELGIESISANSPQAKGRIERIWKTLQDRLIKEMTLAGISSMEDANAFLIPFMKKYNQKFSRLPANPQSNWVALEDDMDIDYYFSTLDQRVVNNDYTISWQGKIFQLTNIKDTKVMPKVKVDVHTTPEEINYVYLNKQRLEYKVIDQKTKTIKSIKDVNTKVTPNPQNMARKRAWMFDKSFAA